MSAYKDGTIRAEDIANFLLVHVEAWGEYEQERAISDLSAEYGRGALYLLGFLYDDPESRSPRVGKPVLKAFQALKKGRISWDNSALAWIVDYYKTGLPEDPKERREVLKRDEARLTSEIAALESPEMWMLQRHGRPALQSAEQTVQQLARLRLQLHQCRQALGREPQLHGRNSLSRAEPQVSRVFEKLLHIAGRAHHLPAD